MEQVAEVTGKWPEAYESISPPDEGEFAWNVFWEMRGAAKTGFSGPERLSFPEIASWEAVRNYKLTNLVLDMILAMDEIYINTWHKKK